MERIGLSTKGGGMGKKRFLGFVMLAAIIFTTVALKAQDVEFFEPFNVYTDKNARGNHFAPSGWMGDYNDIAFTDAWQDDVYSGNTCIKITYRPNASQGARWVGMYWQNPPNNWGEKKGGFDLTGAKKLTFYARGEKGGERIEEVKVGGINGTYPDSDIATAGPIILTRDWQQYSIDLRGKDLSYISGGFVWATNLDANPDGATFYFDDIRYE
jgi:hypothetical protein